MQLPDGRFTDRASDQELEAMLIGYRRRAGEAIHLKLLLPTIVQTVVIAAAIYDRRMPGVYLGLALGPLLAIGIVWERRRCLQFMRAIELALMQRGVIPAPKPR